MTIARSIAGYSNIVGKTGASIHDFIAVRILRTVASRQHPPLHIRCHQPCLCCTLLRGSGVPFPSRTQIGSSLWWLRRQGSEAQPVQMIDGKESFCSEKAAVSTTSSPPSPAESTPGPSMESCEGIWTLKCCVRGRLSTNAPTAERLTSSS